MDFGNENWDRRNVSFIWFPQYEYRRMLGIIRREIRKQIVAPIKVVRLRCWVYYKVIEDISIRWIKLRSVIEEAVNKGFYFGNVRVVDSIPDHARKRIRAIPNELKRVYNI